MIKIVIVGVGICGAAGCGHALHSRYIRASETRKQEVMRERAAKEKEHQSIQGFCESYYRWRGRQPAGSSVSGLDRCCFDAQEMKP